MTATASKPIKIALVYTALNQLGGVTSHIGNIYKFLQGNEFHFKIIVCSSIEQTLRETLTSVGIPLEDVIFIPHAKKITFFPLIFELKKIFIQERFDIIDAFDEQTQVLAGLSARLAGVKCMVGHCDGRFNPSTVSFPKRVLYRLLNHFLKDYFSLSITVSQGLADELIKEGVRSAAKIKVVNLGIKPLYEGEAKNLSYRGFSSGTPVIGGLSRLSSEKGLDRFIKAAALVVKQVPSAHFVVCGNGPQERSLRNLATDLGIDSQVEFKSWTHDVAGILKMYDIYVMPSLREGMPGTLLQAMSMGRPVIASDIEGIREAVDHGVEGALVDTANAEVFAQTMISMCRDTSKAIEMGHRGLERVRSFFTVDKEMQRLRETYLEIL